MKQVRFGRFTLVLLAAWLAGASAASADAPPSAPDKLDPVRTEDRWDLIPWGKDFPTVCAWVEAALTTASRAALSSTPDQHARDRIKAQVIEDAAAFKSSWIEFTGQNTGYNVSVVSREFAHQAGEAMAVQHLGKVTDYYFFRNGALWRLVTTDASKQPFVQLLTQLNKVYGDPTSMTWSDPDKKTDPTSARWQSALLTVDAEAHPDFGTRLIRWTWRTVGDTIDQARGGKVPPGAAGDEGLNQDILDIMQ
jgi:hypothetical protein